MKKILVIRLGAIGDVILTSPALINLKLSFPEAQIFILTRDDLVELAGRFAGADSVLSFPRRGSLVQLFRTAEMLDRIGFDMVIDLHGNFRSNYLMLHIAAPLKIQYRKRRWERYQATLRKGRKRINVSAPHTIDLYNDAVSQAGGKIFATRPILRTMGESGRMLKFGNRSPIVAIAPGASYPTKKWFADRFASLAHEVYFRLGVNLVYLLAASDNLAEMMTEDIQKDRVMTFVDRELTELAQVLAECDVLVCNDSAILHLASSVGTPAIALFGPTHPTLGFAPRGLRDTIIQVDQFCRPCSLHGKCPCYREEQFCFTEITVADVFDRVASMLRGNAKGVKGIFVDRDGTLIKEKDFLRDPDEVEPEEKAIEAIKISNSAGYKVVVLSNQSGVARGLITEETVQKINRRILQVFEKNGAHLDDIFYCPHLPDGSVPDYSVECRCRKPAPGMVEAACRKFNINPFQSFFIGDKLSDISLAHVSGGRGILVRTGYGKGEEAKSLNSGIGKPEKVVDTLLDAVEYLTYIENPASR